MLRPISPGTTPVRTNADARTPTALSAAGERRSAGRTKSAIPTSDDTGLTQALSRASENDNLREGRTQGTHPTIAEELLTWRSSRVRREPRPVGAGVLVS
jgi:hypothetical protein